MKRVDRRLRGAIEEVILASLGVESSSYHGEEEQIT
jgi:hypothetical protein